jgi:predicted metal-dependent hydrolase
MREHLMAFLRFDSGPRTGERVPLDKNKVIFGRAKTSDCIMSHPTVSREHFVVERNNGKIFLVDRGSENGTHANGERVSSWVELNDGDKIQAGPFTLIFEVSNQGEQLPIDGSQQLSDSDAMSEAQQSFETTQSDLYPGQYLQGIEHFNAGRYFDAHEVWEEIWLRSGGETKIFYQMLIQTAVSLHHYERGNARGARGMYTNVIEKLGRLPTAMMSLDLIDFSRQFKNFFADLVERSIDATPPADRSRPQIRLLSRETTAWSL